MDLIPDPLYPSARAIALKFWCPVAFISSTKKILMRCIWEEGFKLDASGDGLRPGPYTFQAWKTAQSTSHVANPDGREFRSMLQIQVAWPELVQAVIALGGTFNTIKSWKRRGLPYGWQMKLLRHYGAPISIVDPRDPSTVATLRKVPIAETWLARHPEVAALASRTTSPK